MAYRVTLQPSGHSFEVPEGKSILTAGLEAGWNMPYSCRAATCRTCRGRILEGRVDYGLAHQAYLSDADKAKGFALLCAAKPLSDVVIEVRELSLHGVKPKVVPCRVKRIRTPAPDIVLLDLKLPMNENMMFAAGQYIDLLLKDGKRRSYSIASPPASKGVIDIELHIRHERGGAFTGHVLSTLKERDLLRFEGPLGTFYLREESDKPIVFVAGGTGFAPIKAMLEYAFQRGIGRPMTLYWGCRTKPDMYMAELAQGWARDHAHFRFIPVLSEPQPEDAWSGRTGLVHLAVMEDFPDLSAYQVYAAGAPVMVEAARRDFTGLRGLPEEEFLADSFLTEADIAGARQPEPSYPSA